MTVEQGEWRIEFYRTQRGESPVMTYLNELPADDRAKAVKFMHLLLEFGTGLGMPHARPLTGHKPLWELRPMPHRILYFAHTGRVFVMLHAFVKKRGKTPSREIQVAEQRMEEFLGRAE
jgi:phage-related protein